MSSGFACGYPRPLCKEQIVLETVVTTLCLPESLAVTSASCFLAEGGERGPSRTAVLTFSKLFHQGIHDGRGSMPWWPQPDPHHGTSKQESSASRLEYSWIPLSAAEWTHWNSHTDPQLLGPLPRPGASAVSRGPWMRARGACACGLCFGAGRNSGKFRSRGLHPSIPGLAFCFFPVPRTELTEGKKETSFGFSQLKSIVTPQHFSVLPFTFFF